MLPSVKTALLSTCLALAVAAPRPTLRFEKRFGGSSDLGIAVATDLAGNVYTTGATALPSFPIANALQPQLGGAYLRLSNDQGKNWKTPGFADPVYAVAGSPKRPNVVLAGTTRALFKSTDSGETWASVPAAPATVYEALVVDASNPDIAYAATAQGIYKSLDGGSTWRQTGYPGKRASVLVTSQARPATLYSIVDLVSSDTRNVFRSIDGGATWSLLENAPSRSFSLACDPADPDTLYSVAYVLGETSFYTALFKSSDGGISWVRQLVTSIPRSTFTLAANKGAAFAATDSGVWTIRTGDEKWTQTTVRTPADNIATDPNDPNIVYASADQLYKSIDGGLTWSVAFPAKQIVQCLVIVPTNPPTVFTGADLGQNIYVTKWSPGGDKMIYSTFLGGSYSDIPTAIP